MRTAHAVFQFLLHDQFRGYHFKQDNS
jgi:hypothetical protein